MIQERRLVLAACVGLALAQTVLFALIQSARATWTGMLEVLELADVQLATQLDYEAREDAYAIVPLSWWAQRTAGLAGNESPPAPLSKDPSR
jgi:hypothetical protein